MAGLTIPGYFGFGTGARSFWVKSIGRAGPLPGGFDRLPQNAAGRLGDRPVAPTRREPFPWGSSEGWPARSMKWKLPHDFCPEGPCPRAWHPTSGHLSVVPISIRFEWFPVFQGSGSTGGHDL